MNDNNFLVLLSILLFLLGSSNSLNATDGTEVEENHFVDGSVQEIQPLLRFTNKEHPNVFQVFSHGKSGKLLIDGVWKNGVELGFWLEEVMPDNIEHINIYGCNFAKGDRGEQAIYYLEWALGVTIAASDNITGRDGDWVLEVGKQIGAIKLTDYSNNLGQAPILKSTDLLRHNGLSVNLIAHRTQLTSIKSESFFH